MIFYFMNGFIRFIICSIISGYGVSFLTCCCEISNPLVVLVISTDKAQYEKGQAVAIQLYLENNSELERTFKFSTGCQYDAEIRSSSAVVWRYLLNRACTEVLTEFALGPGDFVQFTIDWDQTDNGKRQVSDGEYSIIAIIPVINIEEIRSNSVRIKIS